jgi:aspartate carbamoyltransferase catalytic subunit
MNLPADNRPTGRHLLGLAGMDAASLGRLLDRAEGFVADWRAGRPWPRELLAGRTVCNLFFEPSTRTRSSFQLAAQRLGADVLNFDIATSSSKKGETPRDTMRNLEAMGVDAFVVRHAEDGAVAALAAAARAGTAFVNAGDGRSNHPTQGLLDMLTLRQRKGGDFSRLKVLIVGDLLHSRVARSDLHALRALGCGEIRVAGPATLLPLDATLAGCAVFDRFEDALPGVDAVLMLRLQRERMAEGLVESLESYHRDWGLDAARLRLARPDAVVMHPGPINRGVEITDEVADGPRSAILDQVANGVAVRMAVLADLLA